MLSEKPLPILSKRLEGPTSFLASKQLALLLFLLLCISLIPGTLAESNFHASILSRVIIGCMGLNLIFCTMQRMRTLAKPVLVLHLGAILTMAGAVTSAFGFVATVNIYEGTRVDTVYRWDQEKDSPLGVDLTVRKIISEYYPVPVKIGVLKREEKAGLFELKTGNAFVLDRYLVRAESLEMPLENLKLSVFQEGQLIGSTDTDGAKDLPADFPYDFRLVAYRNPVYKKVGVELALLNGSAVVAEGFVEPNNPLVWNGLYFYHTQIEHDAYGNVYAGIQIVNDPGRPVVYTGFGVMMIGSLLWVYKKLYPS
jgi:hypothetical protein